MRPDITRTLKQLGEPIQDQNTMITLSCTSVGSLKKPHQKSKPLVKLNTKRKSPTTPSTMTWQKWMKLHETRFSNNKPPHQKMSIRIRPMKPPPIIEQWLRSDGVLSGMDPFPPESNSITV
eukprot:PhF_6_TR37455/c0_g1_i1/m.55098